MVSMISEIYVYKVCLQDDFMEVVESPSEEIPNHHEVPKPQDSNCASYSLHPSPRLPTCRICLQDMVGNEVEPPKKVEDCYIPNISFNRVKETCFPHPWFLYIYIYIYI